MAIISGFPLDQVIEYFTSPDIDEWEEGPEELLLEVQMKAGISGVGERRRFLWTNKSNLKLTLLVVHLKSSLGGKEWPIETTEKSGSWLLPPLSQECLRI